MEDEDKENEESQVDLFAEEIAAKREKDIACMQAIIDKFNEEGWPP